MAKIVSVVCVLALIIQACYAPPVTKNKKENEKNSEDESDINGLEDYMEYHRYLKEVVSALESDPEFRQKLEKADESEIKSGKIAEELEFVSHKVRTKLDEIKRIELERLKELTEQKRRLEHPNSIPDDPVHHHLDNTNPHTFEIEDLKKLIAKTTEDLAEADKKRKEQFKQYELEKEYKKQEKLNHTNGAEREKLEKELKEMEEKHKKHEKLHEPGHKAQLEEVWEEQDQMQQDFDPKTFFMLHDIDGNGLWDQDEVKSLFIKELDKMYQQGAPEDDMRERVEEMERMRESVFKEMDTNQDGFIDYNEFWHQTNSNNFKQDNGWQALDEQKPYTNEELEEYIRQQEAANQRHGYQVPQGAYQGYQQVPPGGYQQVHPGGYQQAPPGYQYQQVPPGGYQQGPPGGYQQAPSGGYHPNAVPSQAQYQPGQVPQHPQYAAGQISQNDLNTNEIYPQGYQQQHPNQVNYQNQPGNYQQQQQHNIPQPNVQQQLQGQPPLTHQQQQPLHNQQPQINQQQQQPIHNQQPQINQQQQQPQINQQQQQPIHNQQQQINQQQPIHNQPPQVNQQQPMPNQQPQINQQQPPISNPQQPAINPQVPQANSQPQVNPAQQQANSQSQQANQQIYQPNVPAQSNQV